MIKPIIKDFYSTDFDWIDFVPEFKANFAVWLCVEVGPSGEEGCEIFQVQVCTPTYIEELVEKERKTWVIDTLIVARFDREIIEEILRETVRRCGGDSWEAVSGNLRKFMRSEYEGTRRAF